MVVLKDQATKKQVHIIQQHLGMLRQDFIRFQKRMDQLAKHIDQAQNDVHMVHQSSKKISSRFTKIDEIHLNNTLSTTAAPNTIDQPLEIQGSSVRIRHAAPFFTSQPPKSRHPQKAFLIRPSRTSRP